MDANREPAAVKRKGSALPWMLVLVLMAAGAYGYWSFSRRLDDARAAMMSAERQQEEAQRQADALAAAKDALSKDVAAKEEELAQLKGTYDALQDKMKAEIAEGDIQLTQAGGKLQVDLVDKILFDSGEAEISSRGQEVLQRVGAVLAGIDDKQIQVSGHTDDSPISDRLVSQYPTNWELSSARAINVVRFLNEEAGVPGKRLVASGYGPYHPIASNATPAGRARNRRIEILLTPLLQTVANKQVVAAASAAHPAAPVTPVVVPARATRPVQTASRPAQKATRARSLGTSRRTAVHPARKTASLAQRR